MDSIRRWSAEAVRKFMTMRKRHSDLRSLVFVRDKIYILEDSMGGRQAERQHKAVQFGMQ